MTQLQLILVRHAKAADGPVDIDRPLAPRGRRDAKAIGRVLVGAGVALDRVVVSPARRAQQTWDAARAGMSATVSTVVDRRVYDNELDALFAVIRDTPAEVRTLGLVGHNPSFAELASALDDGRGDADARARLQTGYPTSGVAFFVLPGPWPEVATRTGTLTGFSVARAA